jgi:hypothetical protein
MQELETLRQEGLRIQRESQSEAERVHSDALQFGKQTQQQCEALVARTRQEAATIQDGANRYAEQVLGELEVRLKELSQVVLGGRHELGRLQGVDPAAPRPAVSSEPVAASPARRASNRLRRAVGRGMAS